MWRRWGSIMCMPPSSLMWRVSWWLCHSPTPPRGLQSWLLLVGVVASAFSATFDELWAGLPPLEDIKHVLGEWGVFDPGLDE